MIVIQTRLIPVCALSFFPRYILTKIIAGWFKGAGLIFTLIFAALIAVTAIIESAIIVVAFIIGIIGFFLLVLLQLIYIFALPAAIAIFALVILLKNLADTEAVGKVLGLIFVSLCIVFIVLYFKELAPMLSAK